MGRQPNTKCEICGKPLYRRPYEFKESKEFCCRGCRSELYKNKPEIWGENLDKGRGWNKGKSKKNGDILSYGRPRSDASKKRISDAEKSFWKENPDKLVARNAKLTGLKRSKESIERIREGKKGIPCPEHVKEYLSNLFRGRTFSKEHREKLGIKTKERWNNYTDEEKANCVRKMRTQLKPTKLELALSELLSEEWKYVGDNEVIIGCKNPDFINVNGQKKLIEVFGRYWHTEEDESVRIKHFKQYGFKTLIIWEEELQNKEDLLVKIEEFEKC